MPSYERFTINVVKSESQTPYDEHKVSMTDNVTECYIESTVGERFEIDFKASDQPELWDNKEVFGFFVYVDGSYCGNVMLGAKAGQRPSLSGKSLGKHRAGSPSCAPYIFTETQFSGTMTACA